MIHNADDPASPPWIFFDDEVDRDESYWRDRMLESAEKAAAEREWSWEQPEYDLPYQLVTNTGTIPISYSAAMSEYRRMNWLVDWYKRNTLQTPERWNKVLLRSASMETSPKWFYQMSDDTETTTEKEHIQLMCHPFKLLRDALLKGRSKLGFAANPPTSTVFLNPDGSRFETAGKSPVQAKIAYLKRHKPKNFSFRYSGIDIKGRDPEDAIARLRPHLGPLQAKQIVLEALTNQYPHHPCDESQVMVERVIREDSTSYYFVSKRKQSIYTESRYYDPDPHFEEVFIDGGWLQIYKWHGSLIQRVPANDTWEGHRLTVRDMEMAILAGAEIADYDVDVATHQLGDNALPDYRLRGMDDRKIRDAGSLSWDEAFVYDLLRSCGHDEAAAMLLEMPSNEFVNPLSTMLSDEDVIDMIRYVKQLDSRGTYRKQYPGEDSLYKTLVRLVRGE